MGAKDAWGEGSLTHKIIPIFRKIHRRVDLNRFSYITINVTDVFSAKFPYQKRTITYLIHGCKCDKILKFYILNREAKWVRFWMYERGLRKRYLNRDSSKCIEEINKYIGNQGVVFPKMRFISVKGKIRKK